MTETVLTNIFQELGGEANKEIWVLLEKCFSITLLPILAGVRRQTLPQEINPSLLAILSNAGVNRSIIFAECAIFQIHVVTLDTFKIILLEKMRGVKVELYNKITFIHR